MQPFLHSARKSMPDPMNTDVTVTIKSYNSPSSVPQALTRPAPHRSLCHWMCSRHDQQHPTYIHGTRPEINSLYLRESAPSPGAGCMQGIRRSGQANYLACDFEVKCTVGHLYNDCQMNFHRASDRLGGWTNQW